MRIRTIKRVVAATLLSASSVVAIDGCTAARRVSAPQAAGAVEPAKKEYQWKDMSAGSSFYGDKTKPTPP